jgi:hypothetical protein
VCLLFLFSDLVIASCDIMSSRKYTSSIEKGKRKQTDRQFHRNTESELEKCYTKFANTFSYDGSSDVELYDLISKLKIMKCTLPNDTLFAIEIFQHTRDMDCYLSTCLLRREIS